MSKLTLSDTLGLANPYLYEPLISETTKAKIDRFGRLVPPTSAILLEKRLAQTDTEVDVCLKMDKTDRGQAFYSGSYPTFAPDSILYNEPAWQRIQQFSALWQQADSPINKYSEHLWLEFDNQELNKNILLPCFFFDLPKGTNQDFTWVTELALPTLYGQAVSPKTKTILDNCVASLPQYAYINYVGTMLSRPDSPVRLCIKSDNRITNRMNQQLISF